VFVCDIISRGCAIINPFHLLVSQVFVELIKAKMIINTLRTFREMVLYIKSIFLEFVHQILS